MVSSVLNIPTLSSSFNYQTRMVELHQKMDNLRGRFGLGEVGLRVGAFESDPEALRGERAITIPSWFLFRSEDIPAEFQIERIDDARLKDRQFLERFAGWMNQKIQEAGLTSVCKPIHWGVMQTVIRFLKDPIQFERCKEFILGHEMFHLAHPLKKDREFNLAGAGVAIGSLLMIGNGVLVSLSLISMTFALSLTGIGFLIVGTSLYVLSRAAVKARKEDEKQADLEAVQILGNAQGGIYYFETVQKHNIAVRRKNPSLDRFIDLLGNERQDITHPPLTERIAYLRAWQAAHHS